VTTSGALAGLVVLAHLCFVAFVVVGGLLSWRWQRLLVAHVPAALVALALNLTGSDCPLTGVEKHLRRVAAEPVYRGGFIEHYLVHPVHPAGITAPVRLAIYCIAVVPHVVAYAAILLRARHGCRRPSPGVTSGGRRGSRAPPG